MNLTDRLNEAVNTGAKRREQIAALMTRPEPASNREVFDLITGEGTLDDLACAVLAGGVLQSMGDGLAGDRIEELLTQRLIQYRGDDVERRVLARVLDWVRHANRYNGNVI